MRTANPPITQLVLSIKCPNKWPEISYWWSPPRQSGKLNLLKISEDYKIGREAIEAEDIPVRVNEQTVEIVHVIGCTVHKAARRNRGEGK